MSAMSLPANLDQLSADELRELVRQQAEVITRNDRELNWRKIKIDNNVFFLNKQSDLVLPSGGGMLLRVFVDKMEDAEGVTSVTGNTELKDHAALKAVLNAPYLEGFLSATYKEKTDYDPNSPANNFRRALGMNQVGTIQTSVSMYGNRYPLEDALKLFGALKSVGAQAVK